MSLIVHNVIKGSLSVNFEYFESDELFGYTVEGNYQVDISDLSFANNEGVLISGKEALENAYLQKNITARIGGDEYVNGQITSLSFGESHLVGSLVANITITEGKRLDSYSSHTFAEYLPNPHLLSSFDETFDFSRDGENYSYNRNVSIQYKNNTEASNEFLHNVKVFISNYYHAVRPNYGNLTDGISENARFDNKFEGIFSENIDLINLSYSLEEKFDSSFIDASNNVGRNTLIKEDLDEAGYLSKTYTIKLKSLRRNSTDILQTATQNIITEILAQEASQYGTPKTIDRGFSRNGNSSTLNISFSTNPNDFRDQTVIYNCSKQKIGQFNDYSLSQSYKSVGKDNRARFDSCRDFWNVDTGGSAARVAALFPEATAIFEKNRNTVIDYGEATISDTIVYTDDPEFDQSSLPEGILKYKKTLQYNSGVDRFTRVIDVEGNPEKLTISSNKTLSTATVTAEAVSVQAYGQDYAKNFLAGKTSELNDLLQAAEFYITSDVYNIDLANGTTSRVINYVIPDNT
jgi:hypothetical protein